MTHKLKITLDSILPARMKALAERIQREFRNGRDHCFIGEWELNDVWPDEHERESKLRQFAVYYGFRLEGYEKGLGAIFVASKKKTTAR